MVLVFLRGDGLFNPASIGAPLVVRGESVTQSARAASVDHSVVVVLEGRRKDLMHRFPRIPQA